jgi:hypothetical protein
VHHDNKKEGRDLGAAAHRKRGSGGSLTSVRRCSSGPGVAGLASQAPSYHRESPGPTHKPGQTVRRVVIGGAAEIGEACGSDVLPDGFWRW